MGMGNALHRPAEDRDLHITSSALPRRRPTGAYTRPVSAQRERFVQDTLGGFNDEDGSGQGEKWMSVRPRGLNSSTFRLNVSAFCGVGSECRGCVGGIRRYSGLYRVYFMSETAEVELKIGRV